MQGSRAPCVKARVSGRCAAVPEGLPVTFMFSNVCEGKKILEMAQKGWVGGGAFNKGQFYLIHLGWGC